MTTLGRVVNGATTATVLGATVLGPGGGGGTVTDWTLFVAGVDVGPPVGAVDACVVLPADRCVAVITSAIASRMREISRVRCSLWTPSTSAMACAPLEKPVTCQGRSPEPRQVQWRCRRASLRRSGARRRSGPSERRRSCGSVRRRGDRWRDRLCCRATISVDLRWPKPAMPAS
jgi:hypothetical protein